MSSVSKVNDLKDIKKCIDETKEWSSGKLLLESQPLAFLQDINEAMIPDQLTPCFYGEHRNGKAGIIPSEFMGNGRVGNYVL